MNLDFLVFLAPKSSYSINSLGNELILIPKQNQFQ